MEVSRNELQRISRNSTPVLTLAATERRLCWAPTISKPRGQRSPWFLLIPARSCECSSTTRGIRGNPASAPTAKVSSTLSVKREWTICGCNRWTGGPGRQLTNFGSLKIYSYQWSPDGKSLALVRGDSPSDLVLIQNSPGK